MPLGTLEGRFILNNHRQSVKIIEDNEPLLAGLENLHHVSRWDFSDYLDQERVYLSNLTKEPEAITMRIAYTEALKKFYKTE
jgi:hypothetical protein